MNSVNSIIAKHFDSSNGELCFGKISVGELAARFGTPLYIYDRGVADHKLDLLRDSLPAEFQIFYSVKANPAGAILRHFVSHGCGLEVASAGELQRALDAGCPNQEIVFAGPGKRADELESALMHKIGEIHVESATELARVSAISGRLGMRAKIAVRVNPTGEAQGGAMRMGGKPAPFGIDEETLDEFVERAIADPAIELCGVHLFTGTQILDAALLLRQYQKGLAIGRRVAARLAKPLGSLDFGGGLGIPYFANEHELDMAHLKRGLEAIMHEVRGADCFAGTRFVIEPGRFLIGEAGVYVARVNDIKVSRGKKYLILDGGMNHHLAASGNLGQVIKRNFPMTVVNKLDCANAANADVVGPLCTPLDTLARDIELPIADIGDLVGVFQSGAYGLSASPGGFLSHPIAAEVWIDGDHAELIAPSAGAAAS